VPVFSTLGGDEMKVYDEWESFIDNQLMFDCCCIGYAKVFCQLKKKLSLPESIFEYYCSEGGGSNIFKMKYMDGLTAESIAEQENIDRRTVFKMLDKEMLNFGTWLYKKIYIPNKLNTSI
jgi:hypothetical protein